MRTKAFSSFWRVTGVVLIVGVLAFIVWHRITPTEQAPPAAPPVQPVRVAVAIQRDVPEYLDGLGTVTPAATALVRSRVDGLLERLHFKEGQKVKAGTLLAEIDPRPFQVSLAEAKGLLSRDQAILDNARRDLERYRQLGKTGGISEKEVDTQRALVRQYEGIVKNNAARVAAAQLQLDYSRVTAPISGRLGLRAVNEGNMIHASDTEGIVRITQTDPIHVVFTLPESRIPLILQGIRSQTTPLTVEAWDREGKNLLATGKLLTVDNQIDPATGTVKLKAVFENKEGVLFPNQFVNARLLVQHLKNVVTIPPSAITLGADGNFVYVVQDNGMVAMRPVTLGWTTNRLAVVDKGVQAGDTVVIDGLDRLRDGTRVSVPAHTMEEDDASMPHAAQDDPS